ncbi:transmembrane protein 272-like [Sebastes fasciatus]|uniref:transmembrane protein 272-like n=1 Tax=Sebastes fasciatus TaxID=394691 RepID=UPI003D9FAEAD
MCPTGAIYLDDCPRQPFIPVYLIVMGVFGLVLAVLSSLCITKTPDDDTSSPIIRLCTALNSLIACFLFCWFITGNVWIFSIYQPNYNKNTTNVDLYCDKTLYLFAFWTSILFYMLLGLFLVSCCCAIVLTLCCVAAADDDNYHDQRTNEVMGCIS